MMSDVLTHVYPLINYTHKKEYTITLGVFLAFPLLLHHLPSHPDLISSFRCIIHACMLWSCSLKKPWIMRGRCVYVHEEAQDKAIYSPASILAFCKAAMHGRPLSESLPRSDLIDDLDRYLTHTWPVVRATDLMHAHRSSRHDHDIWPVTCTQWAVVGSGSHASFWSSNGALGVRFFFCHEMAWTGKPLHLLCTTPANCCIIIRGRRYACLYNC